MNSEINWVRQLRTEAWNFEIHLDQIEELFFHGSWKSTCRKADCK